MLYKIPLLLAPQPEGGFTVTSPLLPELVTEGDTIGEVLVNVQDALDAVVEAYDDLRRPLPPEQRLEVLDFVGPIRARAYPANSLRPYGLCAGEFHVPEDFDAPLPDTELVLFEA